MIFQDKMDGLRDRFERLSQRERTMVTALGVTFCIMVTLIVGFLITDGLSSLEERNSAMRQALKDIETHRDSYLKARAKTAQLETRLGHGSIQLGSYVEQAAKEVGVEIPESNDHAPAPAGKQWVERAVDLSLHHVKLDQLANFMKKIETGPNLVVVTALNIRTRDDKHTDLDVEMTVSTYERAKPADKGAGKKGDKG
jgi:hypothetical protein